MSGQEERAFRRPFSSVPDIESYYPSVSAEGARVRLFRALDRGEGVAFLFGEAGLGKTLLFRVLANQFELDAPVITLSSARISSRRSFYLQLLFKLRYDASVSDEDELRIRFFEYLRRSDYSHYILFIDNGETLPFAVIDEIRALLDVEYRGEPRFRVAFAGLPRFEERLNEPKYSRFSQRVTARTWLDPFGRDETLDYIARQMKRVAEDYGGLSFDVDAAKLVHKFADGVPRLINQICDLAIYLNGERNAAISEATVRKAWGRLQQIPEEDMQPSFPDGGLGDGVSSLSDEEGSFSVIEFGELDDESVPQVERDESRNPESGVSYGPLSEESTATEEAIIPFVPKPSLPEEKPRVLREEEIVGGEESEILPMDGRNIYWQADSDQCCADVPCKGEDWDADEIVDESDAVLEYDSMIRAKLLRDFPGENEETVSTHRIEEDALRRDITGQPDRLMEQLRLKEMEVAQELDVIRKIRQMHDGLASCHNLGETFPEPESVKKEQPKNRPFLNVFEKIYTKQDKKR